MTEKGTFYTDISKEFRIALLNYSIHKNLDGEYKQKDFAVYAKVNPTQINSVASGRNRGDNVRREIYDFTTSWYWNFHDKTDKPEK